MQDKLKILNQAIGADRVKFDIDISDQLYTQSPTQAAGFYIATTKRELIRIVELARELKIDYLVVGMGSRVTLPPTGFLGLMIKNRADQVKVSGIKGKVTPNGIGVEEANVEADSGLSLSTLALFSIKQNLTGLEGLTESVGSVGGEIWTNPILRAFISKIEVLDLHNEVLAKDLTNLEKEDLVLSVILKLKAR